MLTRYLPFRDLRSYQPAYFRRDLIASASVTFLDIPQGVAYAIIAGLPPAMGLYAAAIPAIIGALFRSSRHVVTGPTNALSLLVGSAVAAQAAQYGATPVTVGVTLAFVVGIIQLLSGLLRLDAVADYISQPVLRGYITGAATLVGAGQLANAIGTQARSGNLWETLINWSATLPQAQPLAVAFTVGTLVTVLALRRLNRRIPGALVAMVASIIVTSAFDLQAYGLRLVQDLAPIPAGLPPFTIPDVILMVGLLPAAVACAVLSLVESSSVARALASRSGQRLDLAVEFTGQGLANITAGFFSGYPISGSMGRSALNQLAGAESRLSGVFCGLFMLLVLLLLGPIVAYTPVASLAGLLFILANDLMDRERIRTILRSSRSDRLAFLATVIGAWSLPLDKAIYFGVGISIILFLQRARLLTMREMVIGSERRFREIDVGTPKEQPSCTSIKILNFTGPLFFAVAGELDNALDPFVNDPNVRVLILRVREVQDFDVTTASVIEAAASKMAAQGRTLLILGVHPPISTLLEQTGIGDRIGQENIFPMQTGLFTAMEFALRRALSLIGKHGCEDHCPFAEYVEEQEELRKTADVSARAIWIPDL